MLGVSVCYIAPEPPAPHAPTITSIVSTRTRRLATAGKHEAVGAQTAHRKYAGKHYRSGDAGPASGGG